MRPKTAPFIRPGAAGIVEIKDAADQFAGRVQARDRRAISIDDTGAGVDGEFNLEVCCVAMPVKDSPAILLCFRGSIASCRRRAP